jgi:hypothetical protein
MTDPKRDLLRHTLATLAYRGGKTVHNAPAAFAACLAAPGARTPAAILAHIGDLLDWSLGLCEGVHRWHAAAPLPWDAEVARFFVGLERLDDRLASTTPLGCSEEQLFQGPIADALTHVGQLAMLRRLADAPIRAENYFRAEIVAGRVGAEQSSDRVEFD